MVERSPHKAKVIGSSPIVGTLKNQRFFSASTHKLKIFSVNPSPPLNIMFRKSQYKVVLQKRNYDCGVAASMAILVNSGYKASYKKLEKDLKLTKEGVSYATIAKYFKSLSETRSKTKIKAKIKDLKSELEKGNICMVVYQSWGKPHELEELECGHYGVVVNITKDKVYLLDPGAYEDWGDGIGFRIMKLKDFKEKWVDKEYGKLVKGWMLSLKPII